MSVNADPLVRSLPDLPDMLAKIRTGLYTLHGGVVRHTSGTEKGGQIVGHLIFPGGSQLTEERLQQLQATLSKGFESIDSGMGHLQQSMDVLQGLQSANLVMSGLNLAVTAAGFVIVCKKLDGISEQIHAQSHAINQTLQLVGDLQDRGVMMDKAQCLALTETALQFCEMGEVEQLKGLIAPFNKEYHFTRSVLEKHASNAASSYVHLNELRLLQNRLINLGLMTAHVQMKIGAINYGRKCISRLESDLIALNAQRVEVLANDRNVASKINQEQFADMRNFLQLGKSVLPALTYQTDVMELEMRHPGLIERASGSKEILLIAA